MTRRAFAVAASALAVSVGVHASGLIALAPEPARSLEGGPAQLAMIGNSFEDAVAGRLTPSEQVSETEPVTPPETTQAPTPEVTPATAPVSEPLTAEATPPAEPMPTETTPAAVPVVPNTPAIVPTAPTPPEITTQAAPPEETAPAPPDRIVAQSGPEVQTPDADTPRPQPRGERPAQVVEAPRREPPAQQAPTGSAAQDSRAGQTTGNAQGNAAQSAQGGAAQSASDGRAAAAYPQQVNRHLSRLRRPSARFNGETVVTFTIAPGGGLASVVVARSSGSAEFDQIAVSHVHGAAPFPAPPPGAQRSFNVTVQGR